MHDRQTPTPQQSNILRTLTPAPHNNTNPSPVKQTNPTINTPHQDRLTNIKQWNRP